MDYLYYTNWIPTWTPSTSGKGQIVQLCCIYEINNSSIELVCYQPHGRDWVQHFLECYLQLDLVFGLSIEAVRIKEASPVVLFWIY